MVFLYNYTLILDRIIIAHIESNARNTKKVPKDTVSAAPRPHGESLWDLEIEKEASETLNGTYYRTLNNNF